MTTAIAGPPTDTVAARLPRRLGTMAAQRLRRQLAGAGLVGAREFAEVPEAPVEGDGQHRMQKASDVFLGWTRGKNGLDVHVRQLPDMKVSAIIADWDKASLRQYARTCTHTLAGAHARTGDAFIMSGYMGCGQTFGDVIGEFPVEFADQNCADDRAFVRMIREVRIPATVEGRACAAPPGPVAMHADRWID